MAPPAWFTGCRGPGREHPSPCRCPYPAKQPRSCVLNHGVHCQVAEVEGPVFVFNSYVRCA